MRLVDVPTPLPLYRELLAETTHIWHNLPKMFDNAKLDTTVIGEYLAASRIEVRFFDSLGKSVFVRKSADNNYTLFIPTGAFDRLYLLTLLFMAGENIASIEVVDSIRDRGDVQPIIPRRLKSIFDPDEDTFLSSAYGLIRDHCHGNISLHFMRQAFMTATFFLAQHELAHILGSHFEVREMLTNHPIYSYTDAALGSSRREIYEGFEVSADQEAARYTSKFIEGFIAHEALNDEITAVDILNHCAIGLALLVSLFDNRKRSLDMPGDGFYPHPLVRWTIISHSVAECLKPPLSEQFLVCCSAASEVVTLFINGLLFEELSSEESSPSGHPHTLAQLTFDRSLISESVLFEHVIRSSERGKRIVFTARILELVPITGVADVWRADPAQRWMHFMQRFSSMQNRNSLAHAQDHNSTSKSPPAKSLPRPILSRAGVSANRIISRLLAPWGVVRDRNQ